MCQRYVNVGDGIKDTQSGVVFRDYYYLTDLLNLKEEKIKELENEL